MSTIPGHQATFRDVFAVREFRALWASQLLSELGDRLTLVALTLLIYHQTGSPLLSALTYAAGSLPWVAGSLIFSGLGDRLPRREVMVACDVIRALMVAVMLFPGMPITVLVGLLYLTTMAQAPFEAARSAVLPDVLHGERYALAATVMQTSFRVALVAGAAVGEWRSPSWAPGPPSPWTPPRSSLRPCSSASAPGSGPPRPGSTGTRSNSWPRASGC